MTGVERCSPATEQEYLEDNIATVAFHLGRPGARLSVSNDAGVVGLIVDPGEVLREISRRLSGPAYTTPSREEIARIIDPHSFEYRQSMLAAGIADGMTAEESQEQADRVTRTSIPEALAKADAILALPSTEHSTERARGASSSGGSSHDPAELSSPQRGGT